MKEVVPNGSNGVPIGGTLVSWWGTLVLKGGTLLMMTEGRSTKTCYLWGLVEWDMWLPW